MGAFSISKTLKRGFEGLNGKMSDFNAFVQANMNVVKVYVPKNVRLNGGSVLAPYQITRGTLPSVAMRKGASGVLVSDIAVGSLVIGEETTVADLACAVVAMNADWEKGDQITFFYGDLSLQAIFAADAPQGGGGNDDDNDDDNPGGCGGEGGDDPYNYGDD